jgi:hypothetical protein
MDWTCKQCGKCCINEPDRDEWKRARLSPEDELTFHIERLKYGFTPKGCEAFIFTDKYECLVHKLFGYDKKPLTCQEWKEDNCYSTSEGITS